MYAARVPIRFEDSDVGLETSIKVDRTERMRSGRFSLTSCSYTKQGISIKPIPDSFQILLSLFGHNARTAHELRETYLTIDWYSSCRVANCIASSSIVSRYVTLKQNSLDSVSMYFYQYKFLTPVEIVLFSLGSHGHNHCNHKMESCTILDTSLQVISKDGKNNFQICKNTYLVMS